MEFMKRFRLVFVLMLLFQLVALPLYAGAEKENQKVPFWVTPVNYLALGDSLAFGVDPNGMPGKGYPDFLAETLDEQGVLKHSNKGFAYPGYTADHVLEDLQNNVSKPVIGIGQEEKTVTMYEAIEEADVITISVGANDILKYVDVNIETGAPEVNMGDLMVGLQQLGVNYQKILSGIYQKNPDANVYVMGYYNPFPYLKAEYQPQIAQLLSQLNETIQMGMKGTDAVFVPTADAIAADFPAHLPNPENIHLSEAGYKVVAQQFDREFHEHTPWLVPNTLTATVKNSTAVTLAWKQAGAADSVEKYMIYQGIENAEKVGEVNGDVTTFDVENLIPDYEYTFTISAVDDEGQESLLNPVVKITINSSEMFPDIENHWAKSFIEQATYAGIFNGYPDGTFKPNNRLTRAQAAAIIVRALDLKATQPSPFKDINGYDVETQAEIAAAYQFGIVKGSEGKFNPSEIVTRSQLALMVKRSYELITNQEYIVNEFAPFPDIQHLDEESKTAITLLYQYDIVSGSNGKYMPADPTTRAQAAKIFVNYLEKVSQLTLMMEQAE